MKYWKLYCIFLFFFISFISCKKPETTKSASYIPKLVFFQEPKFKSFLEERAIDNYLSSFSIKEKLSQLFIINLEGASQYSQVYDYNEGFCPGGFIYFSFNIAKSSEELMRFNNSIQDYYKDSIPPFLTIDLEGGLVNRLRNIISVFPSAQEISELFTPEEARLFYTHIAMQSHSLGFSLNLAPIVEPLVEENALFLANRSFGSIENTKDYSLAFIEAFNEAHIVCSLKHFPGNANLDPHLSLPSLTVSKTYLDEIMLSPFRFVLNSQEENNALLLSHVIVPSLSNKPSSVSFEIIDFLKHDFGYEGLIITDDIFMDALQSFTIDDKNAVLLSLNAGAHMVLSSKRKFIQFLPVLESMYKEDIDFKRKIDIALRKIIRAKIDANLLGFYQKNSWSSLCLLAQKNNQSIKKRLDIFAEAKDKATQMLFEAELN